MAPSKPPNFKWVPKGMDPSSACRLAIRIPAYVEQRSDGKDDYHVTENLIRVVDKDTSCWFDLLDMLNNEIVHGPDQTLSVTYCDKNSSRYVNLDSDKALMEAFDMYWEIRKLPIQATSVISTQQSHVGTIQEAEPVPHILTAEDTNKVQHNEEANLDTNNGEAIPDINNDEAVPDTTNDWGESDEIEYVGVDDEKANYKDLVSDDEDGGAEYYNDSDPDDKDPCEVDDEEGCSHMMHVTDIDNPKIAVGVTFEDASCFKRCIRQYAVLNEVELAVPYSESTRYRAYCKAKRCRWRIHASRVQDGRTWQIKKMPYKNTCASTSKFEHNCMASNHWVKDRVINWLRLDPTIGAKALKERLEEKYCIKVSYYLL
ncbi:unnamed protein product [Urochloa humidicola]